MGWYKIDFTPEQVASGIAQIVENLVLGTIVADDAPSHAVYFATYRTGPREDGGFTAYLSPALIAHLPHLVSSYSAVACERPDADSVRTWVGVEPLASRMLTEEQERENG